VSNDDENGAVGRADRRAMGGRRERDAYEPVGTGVPVECILPERTVDVVTAVIVGD